MIKNQKNKITTKLTLFKSNITVQSDNKKQNSLASSLSSQIIKKLKGETTDNFPQIGKRNLSQDRQVVVSTRPSNTKRINSFNNSRLVSPTNRKISVENIDSKGLLTNTSYVNFSK